MIVVVAGVVLAALAWAWLFSVDAATASGPRRPATAFGPRRPATAFGPRRPATAFGPRRPGGFWERAVVAGLVIGTYGAVAERQRLGELLRPTVFDVALGVAAAAALYGAFWLGERLIARWRPSMGDEVADLYAIRGGARARRMVGVLLLVGPCEEIFWRGFVQSRAGVAVALVGYAAVHLWERKAVLVLAALAGGAAWAGLFAWRTTLVAPMVCHALWDLAVVVWFPFRRPAE